MTRFAAPTTTPAPCCARVCACAGVDPGRVVLHVYPGAPAVEKPEGREVISVVRESLTRPEYFVSRIARGLAKVRLIDDGKMAPDHPDLPRMAELAAVYLGLGVFVANHIFREAYSGLGLAQTWAMYQTGNLSERSAGYALALFARARGEAEDVAWARSLRPNVRQVFRDGMAFLAKTGDTQFRLDEDPDERVQDEGQRLARRVAALEAPSSGARLAALWELQRMGPKAAPAVEALTRALRDAEPSLRAAAAEALAAAGPAAESAIPELVEAAMQDENKALRLQAVYALGAVAARADYVVPHLICVLRSAEGDLRLAAIRALGALGTGAAVEKLIGLLTDVDGNVAEEAALALGAIGPAARSAVPALLRMLRDGGYRPAGAAYALGRIGRVDDRIVPALAMAMQHAVPDVREEAEIALRRIAPELVADLPRADAAPEGEQRIRRQVTAGIMARCTRFTVGEP